MLQLSKIDIAQINVPDNLLQSFWWAEFKTRFGWSAHPFRVSDPASLDEAVDVLVLVRRFAPGYSLAYVPHGPPEPLAGRLSELAQELRKQLAKDVFLVRFDPRWPNESARSIRKAPVDVQPAHTVLIDVRKEPEEILAAMKSKWRYNIRLAFRKGVTVRTSDRESLDSDVTTFYELYRETSLRDRISIHPEQYYRTFLDLPGNSVKRDLLIAEHDGEALAAIVTATVGGRATYVFGAAGERKRNLMPAYALQWEAMRTAHSRGCHTYDLFGIPPSDDPNHPMHGLYRFKTGFGGSVVSYPGALDASVRPLKAAVYRVGESARAWYYLRFRKR